VTVQGSHKVYFIWSEGSSSWSLEGGTLLVLAWDGLIGSLSLGSSRRLVCIFATTTTTTTTTTTLREIVGLAGECEGSALVGSGLICQW